MTRETYACRRFTVVLDTDPDAEPVRYGMQCAVCGAFGPVVEASKEPVEAAQEKANREARQEAAGWVAEHRRSHRHHYTYRCVEVTPYHLVPGAWR